MQLFGRGLRRRLPPMLGGDQQWIRMAYSLMFSMPGAPTLFYGEEIGMGENLAVDGRLAVRTPMQWEDGPAAGFTMLRLPRSPAAAPTATTAPTPSTCGTSAPIRLSAELVRAADPAPQGAPEIGWGVFRVLDCGDAVLALRFEWEDRTLVTLHNLARRAAKASLAPPVEGWCPARSLRLGTGDQGPQWARHGRAGSRTAIAGWGSSRPTEYWHTTVANRAEVR